MLRVVLLTGRLVAVMVTPYSLQNLRAMACRCEARFSSGTGKRHPRFSIEPFNSWTRGSTPSQEGNSHLLKVTQPLKTPEF